MPKNSSTKDIIDGFSRDTEIDGGLKKLLPVATAFMCCIDGDVDAAERNRVAQLGKKFLGRQFIKKDFEQAIDDLSSALSGFDQSRLGDFEDILIRSFSGFTFSSDKEKHALIALFCEIAHADGSVHENEVRFIDRLSDAIEFENPFKLDVTSQTQKSLPVSDAFLEGAEAFALVSRMLTDAMIEGGMVPKERRTECLMVATRVVTQNMKSAIALMDKDDVARGIAFLELTKAIKMEMGISDREPMKKAGYSSTIYADTPEELKAKKRKVDIYASVGILSIVGFLSSFGYAIYLFLNDRDGIFNFLLLGIALFVLQKWVGRKHDELTG